MAYYENAKSVGVVAGADLSNDQRKFLTLNSSSQAVVVSTQGAMVDGILAEAVDAAGKATSMVIPDGAIAKVSAGASFSAGDELVADANGQAIAASGGTTGDVKIAKALSAAGAADEVVPALFGYRGTVA